MTMGSAANHAIHGPNIAKYLERMSRANDQLIKLAELIADAEKENKEIDPEEMYRQLEGH